MVNSIGVGGTPLPVFKTWAIKGYWLLSVHQALAKQFFCTVYVQTAVGVRASESFLFC